MKSTAKITLLLTATTLLASCGRKTAETKPERRNITESVFATGVLVPENKYNLTAESDGYLVSLNFDEGDTVKTGSVLAIIENKTSDVNTQSASRLLSIASKNLASEAPALKQAEANAKAAKEKFRQDSLQAERYKKLYETNSVSKLEYENILLARENSQASLTAAVESYHLAKQQAEQQYIMQKSQADISGILQGNNELKAVIGGKVYQKYKELGDYVRRGEIIAVIGHPALLYARLSVDEANISKIKPGQKAIIQLNPDKEKTYNGTVTGIEPAFDERTQSFFCRAGFTDELDFKISGTQLQANIITGQKENVLVIPTAYLGYGNKVMTKSDGEVTVQTGFVSTEWVEITGGLDENTAIVTHKIK